MHWGKVTYSSWEGGRLLVGWQEAHDTFPRGYYHPPPSPVYLVSGRGTFLAWLAATIPPLPSSPFYKYILLQLAAHAHGYMMLGNPAAATSLKQIYIDGVHVSCRRQTVRGWGWVKLLQYELGLNWAHGARPVWRRCEVCSQADWRSRIITS